MTLHIDAELQELGTTLNTEVTAILIGGWAMAFRGLKNTTKDIDLVAKTEVEFERLLAALDEQGYEDVSDLNETIEVRNGKQFTTDIRESLDELYDQCEVQTLLEEIIDEYYAQYMDELEVRLVLSEDEPMSVEAIEGERVSIGSTSSSSWSDSKRTGCRAESCRIC